ncbi:NADH dehydrogenase [Bradyrhizobium sp. USDA 4532]|uniref:NAD(P)/FAD-dependent oxidoreductase n=1 Tax=Bradyrhizobium TaxID=374 RepID=UPI000976FD61|nr:MULTISPECIES: FAD-dependent oxidoreductase [Bradyrhizobium]MCP1834490.1 NADH dehydrogenase [Bradyrhizobium sp. USDA 4545]MCP1919235.1 NADH dehydrogenase [Bradyrhizobium sp. USDA 4532]OMI01155.1 NADH dehydrogenase [Bradyrhizobium brasilense]
MARILVLGAGFAGLWAALGAARKRDEIGARAADTEILVVDRNAYHNIRVRNYEVDLGDVALPLKDLLDPVGVGHMVAEVAAIDSATRAVTIKTSAGAEVVSYDRLVLTTGSELVRPAISGLAAHGFDVDTYEAAMRLDAHLAALGNEPPSEARASIAVVGAGFTGIEVATEMPAKLAHAGITGDHRVILIDPNPVVGATFGAHGRPVINEALATLGVETRLNVRVSAVGADSITLDSGEIIPTKTVVWCAGMRASPLAASLPARRDALGRIKVDHTMRVEGLADVFAAGDVAACLIDGEHPTVMSCQFARPMGRFAGHNVVADLFGEKLLPLNIDWYVTVLDLGAWGALYTTGWDREVHTTGAAAKLTKQTINQQRIYPPRNGDRAALLAAAAPTIQTAPPTRK